MKRLDEGAKDSKRMWGRKVRLTETLRQALALQQNGRLREAEILYRQVLRVQPEQPDAMHFLGLIAHQCGRDAAAIELIEKSIAFSPDNPSYYNNLGGVYKKGR